ncbi:MAG: GNAT family N-acetyltransferase [Verrucomicrobiales bacterium]|nr:GNAT family N-acetyltransferase [Verrucomicrobiales bacterium]
MSEFSDWKKADWWYNYNIFDIFNIRTVVHFLPMGCFSSSDSQAICSRGTGEKLSESFRTNGTEADRDLIVLRSLVELEQWESEWNQLVSTNPEITSAFRWNQAWYRAHLQHLDEMLVFLSMRDDCLSAILPAYRQGSEIRLASDEFLLSHDLISRDDDAARFAIISIIDWLSAEYSNFQIRWENLSVDGAICRTFLSDDIAPEEFLLFSGESDSRPVASLGNGYPDYIRDLPEETNVELRGALREIDRDLPRAHVEIKRDYNIRVDMLTRALRFIELNGRLCGTPFHFYEETVSFFGELAKCEELGMQLARLVDQGDTLSAEFGFAYRGRFYPVLYAYDSCFEQVKPYESLFISRINDWISRSDSRSVLFPCRDEELASRLSGGDLQTMRSLTLIASRGEHHHKRPAFRDERGCGDATSPVLAR